MPMTKLAIMYLCSVMLPSLAERSSDPADHNERKTSARMRSESIIVRIPLLNQALFLTIKLSLIYTRVFIYLRLA